MRRRSTDMLEVFRGPGRPAGSNRRGKTARPKARRRGARSFFSSAEGLLLAPRQVLLVSCVMVLLLVLAFTVGLGVGRRGGGEGEGAALSRTRDATAGLWYVQGRIPRRDLLSSKPVDPEQVRDELVRRHGFRPSDVRIDEGARGYYFVYYGPFQTQEQARRVLREHNLSVLEVHGTYPFSLEEVVKVER